MPSEPIVTVLPDAGGLHRIELSGSFSHPHWLAFLCAGMSSAGVSVVSGRAVRHSPMLWESWFLVSGPVERIDVVALAATRPLVRDATPPVLTSYDVIRARGGSLELAITAPDALGFLGRFLSRISLLTLVPSDLEIATEQGQIVDRFVLGGIGSAPPSDEVLSALKQMLDGMTPASA